MSTQVKTGRSPEAICEGETGGKLHRAIILSDLAGDLYVVTEEFSYDENDAAKDLVRLAVALKEHVERLAITDDSELTLDHECGACGGRGSWDGKGTPCNECGGTGVEVADAA